MLKTASNLGHLRVLRSSLRARNTLATRTTNCLLRSRVGENQSPWTMCTELCLMQMRHAKLLRRSQIESGRLTRFLSTDKIQNSAYVRFVIGYNVQMEASLGVMRSVISEVLRERLSKRSLELLQEAFATGKRAQHEPKAFEITLLKVLVQELSLLCRSITVLYLFSSTIAQKIQQGGDIPL